MGPVILFYGPVVIRVVIFIQSLFASEFALFINTFATIEAMTIWDSFSQLVFLVAGTITLAFAAIRGEKIRGVMNGAVLGILVSTPLMKFASDLMFVQWAKCTLSGPKTKDFPDGARSHDPPPKRTPCRCQPAVANGLGISTAVRTQALRWAATRMACPTSCRSTFARALAG